MVDVDDEYLGLGPHAFKQMFENLGAPRQGWYHARWKGGVIKLPVFQIGIKNLRYNLFNTRVKPHLSQYIAQNSLPSDYFDNIDSDSKSTQNLIHEFLSKNSDRRDALLYFKAGNQQEVQEPLISTPDGRLVNGNQRLCVYRELYTQDPGKYTHLQTAYVALLPDNGTYEEERDLEATFQDTKLLGVMFDWVQQGLWLVEERKKKSAAHIGRTIGKNESEIKSLIRRIRLAEEFLIYANKPGFWVELRDDMNLTQAFKTLDQQLNTLKTAEEKNALKNTSFKLMSDPEAATKGKKISIHLLISKIANNIDEYIVETNGSPSIPIDLDPLLKPSKRKNLPKKKERINKEVIDAETLNPAELTDVINDIETIRISRKKAKNEKTYAKRQMKSALTSFDNILENWENIDQFGLKTVTKKALKKLEKINSKLQGK
jgi:hypothetical protein